MQFISAKNAYMATLDKRNIEEIRKQIQQGINKAISMGEFHCYIKIERTNSSAPTKQKINNIIIQELKDAGYKACFYGSNDVILIRWEL